jgi:hypothetical protein
MDEPINETDKEYMLFLLKLINNYLLDNEVPSWFGVKKMQLEPLVETAEEETE